MSNSDERCGNCRYYTTNPQDLRQGWCRFQPPVVIALPAPGPGGTMMMNFSGQFPPVLEGGWCGKFESKQRQLMS